jgi:hypothetical protein
VVHGGDARKARDGDETFAAAGHVRGVIELSGGASAEADR